MSSTTVRLTRKELYEEIWKISVAGVSKKYGIPYARCLAKIKAAQIPVPPSGYWTKLNFGKSVEQPPLSGDGDAVVELLQETLPSTADAKKTEQVLPLQEETASEPSSASSPVDTPPQKPPEVETAQMNVTPPETIEKFGQAYNVYHRETLYQEVWAMPVTEVAKRYKVSDAAIHKVCKSLDIPTPPQGYWAKLRAGKPVKKLPLPPGKEQTKLGIQTGISRLANPQTTTASLEFLPEEERQVVLNVAAQILLPQEHARMRPEIVAHRKRIAEWNKRKRQQEREFGANWNRGRSGVYGIMQKWIERWPLSTAHPTMKLRAESVPMFLPWKKPMRIRIFLHGRLGLAQKRIGTTLQSQKRTNFWASENTKRVKRAKGLSTRDTGGKAKVCAPSNLDRIVADLSIPVNNYLNYNLNNC